MRPTRFIIHIVLVLAGLALLACGQENQQAPAATAQPATAPAADPATEPPPAQPEPAPAAEPAKPEPEMSKLMSCALKHPAEHWECSEEGVAAIRDGYCDKEQEGFMSCVMKTPG